MAEPVVTVRGAVNEQAKSRFKSLRWFFEAA